MLGDKVRMEPLTWWQSFGGLGTCCILKQNHHRCGTGVSSSWFISFHIPELKLDVFGGYTQLRDILVLLLHAVPAEGPTPVPDAPSGRFCYCQAERGFLDAKSKSHREASVGPKAPSF